MGSESYVHHYRNCGGDWGDRRRLPNGVWELEGAAPAGGARDIDGVAAGTVLIANPLFILKKIVGGLAGAFRGSPYTKKKYLETLKMLAELLGRARDSRTRAADSSRSRSEHKNKGGEAAPAQAAA